MPIKKQVFFPLLFIFLALNLSGQEHISGKIRVGIYENPPHISIDESDQASGFFGDLIRHIAARKGWDLEFIPVTFNQGLSMVTRGEIDLMTNVAYSEARNQRFLFTKRNIISSWASIYSRDDINLYSFLDLDGLRIGVMQGDVHVYGSNGFLSLTENFGIDLELVEFPSYNNILRAIQSGSVDAGVVNAQFGMDQQNKYLVNPTNIIFNPISIRYVAPKSSLGYRLIEELDQAIEELLDNPDSKYYELVDTYITGVQKTQFRIPNWILYLSLGLVLLLIFLLVFVISTHREIQKRKRIETNLRQAQQEAEEANRAKSSFMANMTHELRTPLNVIIGYIQILQNSKNLNKKEMQEINAIYKSGEHLLGLINDVLDISKLRAEKMHYEPTDMHFKDAMDRIVSLLRVETTRKQITFTTSFSPEIPQYIVSDGKKLRQVLLNLLGNALKFTPPGGSIEFSASIESKEIQFRVRDTGIGISEEKQKVIFNEFTQAIAPGQSEGGTGLGLAISRRLARMLEGELILEYSHSEGTGFLFVIPLIEGKEVQSVPEPTKIILGIKNRQAKPIVLVADDKEENRDILADLLEPLGFEIEMASDGLQCMYKLIQCRPELLILDIRMPGKDGIEVLQEIKADFTDLSCKIIVLTASTLIEQKEKVLKLGADAFMLKPYNHRDLLETIKKLLDLEYSYRELAREMDDSNLDENQGDEKNLEIPEELRDDLEHALVLGSKNRVKEIINSNNRISNYAVQYITERLDRFDFKAIRELIQKGGSID